MGDTTSNQTITYSVGNNSTDSIGFDFTYNQIKAKKPGDLFDGKDIYHEEIDYLDEPAYTEVVDSPDSDYKAIEGIIYQASASFASGFLIGPDTGDFVVADAKLGTGFSVSKILLNEGGTATWVGPDLKTDLFLGFSPFGFLEWPIYTGLRGVVGCGVNAVVQNNIDNALPHFISLECKESISLGVRGYVPIRDDSVLTIGAEALLTQASANTTLVYSGNLSGVFILATWNMF